MKNENKSNPIHKDVTVRIFFCRNCERYFLPEFIYPKLYNGTYKIPLQLPERCTRCKSRWWQIWKKDRVKCQWCGFVIDQSKYTGKLPKHCPKCKRKKYTRNYFSALLNYSKNIRDEIKAEYKEFHRKNKSDKIKSVAKPKIEWSEGFEDNNEGISERLI